MSIFKSCFFILFLFLSLSSFSQNRSWLKGKWYSMPPIDRGTQKDYRVFWIREINLNQFSGLAVTRNLPTEEIRAEINIAGTITGKKMAFNAVENVLFAKRIFAIGYVPTDCGTCGYNSASLILSHDTVYLKAIISGCDQECDGSVVYFRELLEYDTAMQREIVRQLATEPYRKAFVPVQPRPKPVTEVVDRSLLAHGGYSWFKGTWNGTGHISGSAYAQDFVLTLYIDTVNEADFEGHHNNTIDDGKNTHIEHSIHGSLANHQLTFKTDEILSIKQPPADFWCDCTGCKPISNVVIQKDSILILVTVNSCEGCCDGTSKYYKLLSEFDTATQRQILAQFGSPSQIKTFKPVFTKVQAQPAAITPALPSTQVPAPATPSPTQISKKPEELAQRNNTTIATYTVSSPVIELEFLDKAEVDGDIITVYDNQNKIVDRQMLTHDPIKIKVLADASNRTHVFTLVAQNLGSIPPNTALMRVKAGTQTYEVLAKTNLSENASVTVFYSGK